jgi:phage repressor protein C with HTH and peptisase S24 domain
MHEILDRLIIALEQEGYKKHGRATRLSEITGYSIGMISDVLRGKVEISDRFLETLCGKIGLSKEWVLTGIGKPFLSKEDEPSAGQRTGEDEGGYVHVPRYQVSASAGNGAIVVSEQIVDYLKFSGDWLKSYLGLSPDRLALISVIGDSMSPTYNDGDLILVDTAIGRPKSDAVYVLQHDGFLWIKRLNFRFDGSIHVISDNPRYPEQVISGEALDRLKIVGRVMWRGGR